MFLWYVQVQIYLYLDCYNTLFLAILTWLFTKPLRAIYINVFTILLQEIHIWPFPILHHTPEHQSGVDSPSSSYPEKPWFKSQQDLLDSLGFNPTTQMLILPQHMLLYFMSQ